MSDSIPKVGMLLRDWRSTRRLSQLALSLEAGVSARHLSFVETGRAQPSREFLARIADALDMPLRERNVLLVAARFAPEHPERPLDAVEMEPVHRAISAMLRQQEPFPAFLLSRRWDILQANAAAARLGAFLGSRGTHTNMVRMFFDPADLRAVTVNWEEVASDMLRHLQAEVLAMPSDAQARTLLADILRYPGVPTSFHRRQVCAAPSPVLTVHYRKDGRDLRFLSTITTFGTPLDVTIDDIHLECGFPADEATAEFCRTLAAGDA